MVGRAKGERGKHARPHYSDRQRYQTSLALRGGLEAAHIKFFMPYKAKTVTDLWGLVTQEGVLLDQARKPIPRLFIGASSQKNERRSMNLPKPQCPLAATDNIFRHAHDWSIPGYYAADVFDPDGYHSRSSISVVRRNWRREGHNERSYARQSRTTDRHAARTIVRRNRGLVRSGHAADEPRRSGQVLKPFVSSISSTWIRPRFRGRLHPHSGIATVTYRFEGSVRYEDTSGATGVLRAGGVEWLQGRGGAWHGGDPAKAAAPRISALARAAAGAGTWTGGNSLSRTGRGRARRPGACSRRDPRHGHEFAQSPSVAELSAVHLRAGEFWRYQPASTIQLAGSR